MTQYLISFDEGAMTFPQSELPDVARAADEAAQEAVDAGVWVFGGGLTPHRDATAVDVDGTVGPVPHRDDHRYIGGFAVVDVPTLEDALQWGSVSSCTNQTGTVWAEWSGRTDDSHAIGADSRRLPSLRRAAYSSGPNGSTWQVYGPQEVPATTELLAGDIRKGLK